MSDIEDELQNALDYANDPDTDELTLRVYLRETALRAMAFRSEWNAQGFEIIRLEDELNKKENN